MYQNSIWAWTRVTHRGESSADDKRPVCNKMPRQTFSRLRRLHQCTSNCTSGCRCRSPATPLPSQASPATMTTPVFHLPPPLDSFFSPSVRKSARYPAWKFRRGSSVATRPRRPRLTTLMLFDANSSKSSEVDTVDCSVFSLAQCHATAEVSNDEAEIDIKMAKIRSWEKYDAGDTAGAQISKR